jgi:hypothetical protein
MDALAALRSNAGSILQQRGSRPSSYAENGMDVAIRFTTKNLLVEILPQPLATSKSK